MSGRWVRDGPRRITLVWTNDFAGNTQPMLSRTFNLAAEALRGVRRLSVVRALVFIQPPNTSIHERALLAVTVGNGGAEALGVSDPGVAGGLVQWATVSCVLPATGDLGVGSFAFVYQAPDGPQRVAEAAPGSTLDVAALPVRLQFPLLPALADTDVLQCCVELLAE